MNDPAGRSTAVAAAEEPPEEDAQTAEDSRTIVGSTRANLLGAGGCFAVGLYAIVSGLDMGYWSAGPGAGFFPFWMGALMGSLAIAWAIQTLREPLPTAEEPARPRDRYRMLAMLAGILVMAIGMEFVGYQVAMTAFVLFALLVLNRRGWLESVAVAAASGFGVYTLFAGLLQVYLPTASLPLLADLGL